MRVQDLGIMPYRQAWDLQQQIHDQVLAGREERLLLVEHPPVITVGRHPGADRHLLASLELLAARGVELAGTDRGGDITFHGPGQLVAYPIIRLIDHRLSVGAYVHRLEAAIIATLATWGIVARADPAAVGVWVRPGDSPHLCAAPCGPFRQMGTVPLSDATAKVAAIGVRIRRGVSTHGLALNVTTDLSYFQLIVPCGLSQRRVTSLQEVLGDRTPQMEDVKRDLCCQLARALG